MKSNKNTGRFAGKGYYIALILCAVAIGVTGYLYYRNENQDDPLLRDDPDASVAGTVDDNVPAVNPNQPVLKETEPIPDLMADPTESKMMQTCQPLSGEIISDYAMDCLAYNETTRDWRVHDGIDIAADAGTKVCAAADGTVYTVYSDDTMGTTVVIRHEDDYVTVYASLDENVSVAPGDIVIKGQTIATVGNSALLETAIGDHLHFSVTHNGKSMDPEDFFALNK